jgi:hypothetical protein
MADKKLVEEYQLNLFRSLIPDFPEGRISPTEEPDFLVTGLASTVGIELTTLHRPTPSGSVPVQATEAMGQRTIERAGRLYSEKGGIPIRCTANITGAHIRRDDVETLASAIADLALRSLPPESSSVELYDFAGLPLLEQHVASLSIHRFGFITSPFFSASGANWLPRITQNEITGVLRSKGAKHLAYRKRCSAVWLVIVTGYGPTSTWFDASEDVASLGFSTVFDRVYLLDGFGPKLLRLVKL